MSTSPSGCGGMLAILARFAGLISHLGPRGISSPSVRLRTEGGGRWALIQPRTLQATAGGDRANPAAGLAEEAV